MYIKVKKKKIENLRQLLDGFFLLNLAGRHTCDRGSAEGKEEQVEDLPQMAHQILHSLRSSSLVQGGWLGTIDDAFSHILGFLRIVSHACN